MRSNFVFQEIWVGLRRNLTMSVALIVVVAISLSLLGTGLMFVKQVDNTRTVWQSRVQLSLYLGPPGTLGGTCDKNGPVTQAEISTIQQELNNNKDILTATYLSQAEAYKQFRQEFAANEPIVKYTNANQIPASFEVRLKNTEADALPVSQVVNGYPGVAEVVDDSSILSGFSKLMCGGRKR